MNVKHIFKTAVLLVVVASTAFSQDSLSSSSNTCGWMAFSLGPATGNNFLGFSDGIMFNYVKNSRILSARLLYAEQVPTAEIASQFNTTSSQLHFVSDAGLLYGFASKTKFLLLSVSAGVGYVWGRNAEQHSTPYFASIALPVELQIGFTPLKPFGVCAYTFANLNFNNSFFGTMLCIQIGKVQ
jgi:hypothetical protein